MSINQAQQDSGDDGSSTKQASESSEGESPPSTLKKKIVKTKGKATKTSKRKRHSSDSDSEDEEMDSFKVERFFPKGMTPRQAKQFSHEEILTMKQIEMKMKSKEEKELPGTNMALEECRLKVVRIKSGKDDAKDKLHDK